MMRCVPRVAAMVLVLVFAVSQASVQAKKPTPTTKQPAPQGQALVVQMQKQLGPFLKGKPVAKSVLRRWLAKRVLPGEYLQTLYTWHAKYLRNTIFALQGARFKGKDLSTFFAKQTWYKGTRSPRKTRISNLARVNVDRLLFVERIVPTFGRLVGRWPKYLNEKKGAYTFTFHNRKRLVQTPNAVKFYHAPLNNQSIPNPPRLLMTIPRVEIDGEKPKIRGYFGHFLLLHATGSSDMQYIRIYNLATKKLVFKRDTMSGLATFRINRRKGQLLLYKEIPFPKKCSKGKKTYASKESACWPLIQHKHPKLKGVSSPKCKCQGGLSPFVMGEFRLSVGKTLGKPIATGQLKCGCAS